MDKNRINKDIYPIRSTLMNQMPTAKILKFPLLHSIENPPTSSQSKQSIREVKFEHNREVVEYLYEGLISSAQSFGYFNKQSKINDNDLMLLEEILMASLCRYTGVDHPMHEMVDAMFTIDEEDTDVDNS